MIMLDAVNKKDSVQTLDKILPIKASRLVVSNIIEIEGLLFLGFGPMCALHGKLVFPVFPIK